MMRRRRLGQHFLRSDQVASRMVSEARITRDDTVFELGTGLGALTPLLCKEAGHVISVDTDKFLIEKAAASMRDPNLELRACDGLECDDPFTIFVSSLPYSRSRDALEWLASKKFSRGVIIVQKEFAEKLAGVTNRRAVSIVANHAFELRRISVIKRGNFDPPPGVDSVMLGLEQKNVMGAGQVRVINRIFSYRRKTIRNILGQFGIKSADERRLDEMTVKEIVGLADHILR